MSSVIVLTEENFEIYGVAVIDCEGVVDCFVFVISSFPLLSILMINDGQ